MVLSRLLFLIASPDNKFVLSVDQKSPQNLILSSHKLSLPGFNYLINDPRVLSCNISKNLDCSS